MSARILSLLVVIASLTLYHVAQRSLPEGLRPAPVFTLVYGVAALAMLGVTALGGLDTGLAEVRISAGAWPTWLLAAAVLGIELGVFAMYRSGWTISTSNTMYNAIVAALLVVIGLVRFGEHLTPGKIVGLALCLSGAALLAR